MNAFADVGLKAHARTETTGGMLHYSRGIDGVPSKWMMVWVIGQASVQVRSPGS